VHTLEIETLPVKSFNDPSLKKKFNVDPDIGEVLLLESSFRNYKILHRHGLVFEIKFILYIMISQRYKIRVYSDGSDLLIKTFY
jgi:hypothetical protein